MKEKPIMRGAGQCPKCGSRKVVQVANDKVEFYGKVLEVCRNPACKAAWEPFNPDDLLDDHLPKTSSFKEPCDNCAFRQGSCEQKDPEKWKAMMKELKDAELVGGFFCHKGVPLDIHREHGDSGFAYPRDKDGKYLKKKMRPCRGWLSMMHAQLSKKFPVVPE
jgi:hypothetical protein